MAEKTLTVQLTLAQLQALIRGASCLISDYPITSAECADAETAQKVLQTALESGS